MHLINFFLLLLFSHIINTQQQRYTQVTNISNTKNFRKVVFSDDLTHCIFYGQNSSAVYDVYDNNYEKVAVTGLFSKPTALTFFKGNDTFKTILYGNSTGQVRHRLFNNTYFIDFPMFTIEDQFNDISMISTSSDGRYFAIICQNGFTVYIGSISNQQIEEVRKYEDRQVVTGVEWRPYSAQLLISCGNSSELRYLQLYDFESKISEDLTHITQSRVIDIAFNKVGDKIYFVEDNSDKGEEVIKIYDLLARVSSQLIVEATNQLAQISIQGNFLSSSDETQVFIFNLVSGLSYGSYASQLVGNGLSPDGSDLIVYDSSHNTELLIYKLCSSHNFYNSLIDNCQPCQTPCRQCFFEKNRCSKCLETYYLEKQRCILCESVILGCINCESSSNCSLCDASAHRVNDHGYCPCQTGYYSQNGKCKICTVGCLICDSPSFCYKCDESANWVRSDYQCICKEGYSLNSATSSCQLNSTNYTLIIIVASVLLLVVIAAIISLMIKRKRRRAIQTLLQSEEGEEIAAR